MQIYLDKDLLAGEEIISDASEADIESLKNGYLGEESSVDIIAQINNSFLEDAQKLHQENPSNLSEINALLS